MRITSKNKTLVYVIAIAIIVIAFFLLGGGHWLNGSMHRGRHVNMNNLHWVQIIISLIIGFVLGLFVAKRKW